MKKIFIASILVLLASMFLTATPKVEADSEFFYEVYLFYPATAGPGAFWWACFSVGLNQFGEPTGEAIEEYTLEAQFSDPLANAFLWINDFNEPVYMPIFNGQQFVPSFLHGHNDLGWVLESLGPVTTTCDKAISFTEVTSTRHWTFCYDAPLNTI
jgi:hypothetical protein